MLLAYPGLRKSPGAGFKNITLTEVHETALLVSGRFFVVIKLQIRPPAGHMTILKF